MADGTLDRFIALAPLAGGGSWLGFERGPAGPLWPVAIIPVPAEVLEDPDRMDQLREDTARAAQLDHPHILRVLGCDAIASPELSVAAARIVEFGDGESLRRLLEAARRSGRPCLPPRLVARVLADASAGVHHVHEQGQAEGHVRARLHGSLRPETLLVGFDGAAKVTGYGALAVAPRDTFGARLSSRYEYLSPEEVLRGAAATDRRSDVYALGVVLYEALSGRVPFSTDDPDFERKLLGSPAPEEPLARAPALLRELALQALSKSPNERFSSAGQLSQALLSVGVAPQEEVAVELDRLVPSEGDARSTRRRLLEGVGLSGPPWPRPKPSPKAILVAKPVPVSVPPPEPAKVAPPVAAPRPPPAARPAPAPPPAPRAGRTAPLIAVFFSGLLLAGGGVTGLFLHYEPRQAPPPVAALATPAPAAAPLPLPAEAAPADLTPTPLVAPTGRTHAHRARAKAEGAAAPRGQAGMEVTAPPGSRISLDGHSIGTAPLSPLRFAAGAHLIRVTMGKAVFERRFFAHADETLTLDVHPTETP